MYFPREIGLKRRPCESRQVFDSYVDRLNGKANIYTSLFHYERKHPTKGWKFDPDSVVMDRAWWDFDMTEDTTIVDVKRDVHTLVDRLSGDVRMVATGRGFHVHELFQKPVKGTAISRHIVRYENEVAKGLKTLDGVGNPQKLTRVPDTYNVTRGKWAVNVDVAAFMDDPYGYEIADRPGVLSSEDPFRGRESDSDFNIVKWIASNPMKEEELPQERFAGEIGTMNTVPLPPCLEKHIHHENPKHDVRKALVMYLGDSLRWFDHPDNFTPRETQEMAQEICAFIETLGWRDFNMQTTKSHVLSLLKYSRLPSTEWFRARNLCTGPCWLHEN
tara:strand:+ start:765 stop:1757 length:993 start_codon:yes stop_codon:yes gene_type:complete